MIFSTEDVEYTHHLGAKTVFVLKKIKLEMVGCKTSNSYTFMPPVGFEPSDQITKKMWGTQAN